MPSLLLPDSIHLWHRRRTSTNNGKTAAVAAALLALLPSPSSPLPTYPTTSGDPPSSSLSHQPIEPSPLASPDLEFTSFTLQLARLDSDLNTNSPLSSYSSKHWAHQSQQQESIHAATSTIIPPQDPSPPINPLRPELIKRASLETDPNSSPDNLPKPFDTSLGTHFQSSTCGPFIQHMATDPDLIACHPFSFLLSTSSGFFHSLRGTPGYPSLPNVLASTCAADLNACGSLVDQFASRLTASDACGSELQKHNALALEALGGLQNFRLMRAAGCMQADTPTPVSNSSRLHPRNPSAPPAAQSRSTSPNHTDDNKPPDFPTPSTNANLDSANATATSASLPSSTLTPSPPSYTYCFEAAASNARPDDLYYYYLPTGTSLPSGTQPTCDTCTQNLMKLYSAASANASLGIHDTYPAARTVTNAHCGPGFAPMPADKASLGNRSTAVSILTLLSSLLLNAFL